MLQKIASLVKKLYAKDALQNVYRSEKLKSYRYHKNHILKHVIKSSKAPENIIYTSTVEAYRMNTYPPKLPSIENNLKSSLVPLNKEMMSMPISEYTGVLPSERCRRKKL